MQVRIQDLCKGGGPSRDFADIAQRSRGGGKNLGLKMGGQGGARAPGPPPLDPHLCMCVCQNSTCVKIEFFAIRKFYRL